MSEQETQQPRVVQLPEAVIEQVALMIGRGAINQMLSQHYAEANGVELNKVKEDLEDITLLKDQAEAHARTLQAQLAAHEKAEKPAKD